MVPGGLVAAGRRDRPDGRVRPHVVQTNDARLVRTVSQVLGPVHVVMFMAKRPKRSDELGQAVVFYGARQVECLSARFVAASDVGSPFVAVGAVLSQQKALN